MHLSFFRDNLLTATSFISWSVWLISFILIFAVDCFGKEPVTEIVLHTHAGFVKETT